MKKMQIFEPAMCCDTGLCGVGVDSELLRISTVLATLKTNGINVERFNLTNAPMEFVNNKVINEYVNLKGAEGLPVTTLDGVIVVSGRYPTNEELVKFVNVPVSFLGQQPKAANTPKNRSGGCGCSGGGCC